MRWWRIGRILIVGATLLGLCLGAASVDRSGATGDDRRLLAAKERAELDALAAEITVRVDGMSCGAPVSGSGFVVGGRLFTNRHLVEGATTAWVATSPGLDGVEVLVGNVAAHLDVATAAVVPGPGLRFSPAALAAGDAAVGDEVVLAGWVNGALVRRTAHVHLFVDGAPYGASGTIMLVDPATTYGFSGGPILNAEGEVVGILSAVDVTTSLALAVPVSELHAWTENGKLSTAGTSCP